MTWWLLALVFWPACSLPLGLLTARFIAIGNKPMNRHEPPLSWYLDRWLPPGDDWQLWTYEPPAYKRGKVVEVWREELGNETRYWAVDTVPCEVNVAGVWWRPA